MDHLLREFFLKVIPGYIWIAHFSLNTLYSTELKNMEFRIFFILLLLGQSIGYDSVP